MRMRIAAAALSLAAAQAAIAAGPPIAAGAAAGAGANAGELDRVMQLLVEKPHRRARFVERQFFSILDRPLVSSGELAFDAPNRLVQRTFEPHAQTMTVAGDELTIDSGRKHRVLDLRNYPQIAPFVDSIRATLAGDRAELERYFTLKFEGSANRWTLRLTPRDAQLARTVTRILITGTRGDLTDVDVREADGDHSSMRIEMGGAR